MNKASIIAIIIAVVAIAAAAAFSMTVQDKEVGSVEEISLSEPLEIEEGETEISQSVPEGRDLSINLEEKMSLQANP